MTTRVLGGALAALILAVPAFAQSPRGTAEANVGDAARSRNRQEWRADVKGAEGETEEATTEGAAVAEAARKKLDELEKQGL